MPPETLLAFLAGGFLGYLCLLEGLGCLRVACEFSQGTEETADLI